MAGLMIPPQLQFVDSNGSPLAGGLLYTYIPGTLTLKTSYLNAAQTILATNPIVLDIRGTCSMWGDNDYRLILKDANGNQVFDLLSSEPLPASAISAAMLPVVGALTLAQARDLLGVTAAINTAISNISLITGPTGAVGPIGVIGPTGATGPQGSAGTTPSIVTSVVQSDSATSDGTGLISIVYAQPFTTSVQFIGMYMYGPPNFTGISTYLSMVPLFASNTLTGFSAYVYDSAAQIYFLQPVTWVAIGH